MSVTDYDESFLKLSPVLPGYLHVLARNEFGVKREIVELIHSTLSVITEGVWNPFMGRYEIPIGDDLTLECNTTLLRELHWQLNRRDVNASERIVFDEVSDYEFVRTQRLFIGNVSDSDEGKYFCTKEDETFSVGNKYNFISVKNFEYAQKRSSIFVCVIGKDTPKVTAHFEGQKDNQISRNSGESVELECSVGNVSMRNFKWFKDNQPVSKDENLIVSNLGFNRTTLRIKTLTRSDEGKYTCLATNKFGNDSRSVVVSIRSMFRY